MKIIPVDNFDLTIFGATGDLARRKIFPALYRRLQAGQMPSDARIIGASRSAISVDEFRARITAALQENCFASEISPEKLEDFAQKLDYVSLNVADEAGWKALKEKQRENVIHAFYFSVAPSLFSVISKALSTYNIAQHDARIIIEKPFGRDLDTAKILNKELRSSFDETQIYRIDHYLGKETVQNLMAIRFGNSLFEPLWNHHHIDHVQITVAEQLSVAGRGEYYDTSGAMRDMVQNHLMQLLCLTAMEPPSHYHADAVRDEKLKVIRALKPVSFDNIVRGQYLSGADDASYLEHSANLMSKTESYIALKTDIANWRWAGVPFYLRTGKRLRDRVSEIIIHFKKTPHSIFGSETYQNFGNMLRIRLQPNEGITLQVTIKDPGPGGMRLREVPLDMSFAEELGTEISAMPDAYERLIMDVIRGNQTLFMRGDEVEAAWEWVDPIITDWENRQDTPLSYEALSQGPEDALHLLARDGRKWRRIGDI